MGIQIIESCRGFDTVNVWQECETGFEADFGMCEMNLQIMEIVCLD